MEQPVARPTVPTPDHPERGVIAMGEVVLSEVAYWREGPTHVFRSLEFDVMGAHDDLHRAVTMFVENAEDLANHIAALSREELTQDEAETAIALLTRLRDALRASQRRAEERPQPALVRALRGRGNNAARPWYRQSSLRISSPRQPA